MRNFYYPAKNANAPVPRIFGMTASLSSRISGSGQIHGDMLELENNLDCAIMTSTRGNVSQFSTSAKECIVQYKFQGGLFLDAINIRNLIDRATVRLQICNQLCKVRKFGSSSKATWQQDSKKSRGPLEQQIRHIQNVSYVMESMGLLPASYAIGEVAHGWTSIKKFKNKYLVSASQNSKNLLDKAKVEIKEYEQHPKLWNEDFSNPVECLMTSLQDMVIAVISGLFRVNEDDARSQLTIITEKQNPSIQQLKNAIRQIRKQLNLDSVSSVMTTQPIQFQIPDIPEAILQSPEIEVLYSNKMQQLLRLLAQFKNEIPTDSKKEWRGMIFVQQTLMALVLEQVIRLHPDLEFYKCQSLTGHNAAIQAASMEDHHQRKIIRLFQSGKLNLLLCTSVAEEGLDITHCSMVIRFDLPSTDASYIQSRGRARKPGAFYFIFMNQVDQAEKTRIEELRRAEQCMKEFARSRQQLFHYEAGDDEDLISGTEDAFLEMAQKEELALIFDQPLPTEEEGLNIAVEMIHRYVNQLPQDEYCRLSPHLIFRSQEKNNQKEFQYQLTLPLNAAITQPIFGDWCLSKQKARSNVCYKACTKLRELGHLNDRFNPITKKDLFAINRAKPSKFQAEMLASDAPLDPMVLRQDHAKKTENLPFGRLVPPGLDPKLNWELHLLIVNIKNTPKSILSRFGILTFRKLDLLMDFDLFSEQGPMRVEFRDGGVVSVSEDEMKELKRYHVSILEPLYFKSKLFGKIIRGPLNDFCQILDSDLSFIPEGLKQFEDQIPIINQSWYLLTPLRPDEGTQQEQEPDFLNRSLIPMESDEEWRSPIDWELINVISERLGRINIKGIDLDNARLEPGDVIFTPHNPNAYKLVGIRTDLNMNSNFPAKPKAEFYDPSITTEYRPTYIPGRNHQDYASFMDYYKTHWKCEELRPDQPLLECMSFKHVSILKKAKNLLTPIKYQSMEVDGNEEVPLDNWNSAVHLIPQLSVVYPIKYTLWESLSYITAVCWKLESMLKALELHDQLFESESSVSELSLPSPGGGIPVLDIELLYQSVTCRSCHEVSNYERLEFIGDAALKYIASLFCYFKHPVAHEGILSTERSDFISNRHLADVAVSSGIQNYVRSVQIGEHPWRPAGCQLLDGYWIKQGGDATSGPDWFGGRNKKISLKNSTHQAKTVSLKFKQVADVVEALIGACFVHGGIPFACVLIDRLGILESSASFLLTSQKTPENNRESCAWLRKLNDSMLPELEGLEQYPESRLQQYEHGRNISTLQGAINHQFECPCFAMEAVTHCSWAHNDPPCYQRLEYLGDAVLDFMVSIHYFEEFQKIDPGALTALRSASVNNDKLATNAVKLGLHKCILHFSSTLQAHISEYIGRLESEQDITYDGEKGAPKVLGDIIESLIGAVYLDTYGDFNKTWAIWRPLLEPFYTPEAIPTHPVVQLMTICQRYGMKCEFIRARNRLTFVEAPIEMDDEMDITSESDSNDEDEEMLSREELSGKHGLEQLEPTKKLEKVVCQVTINGVVQGEGTGNHMKIAKKHAAIEALKSDLWNKE